MGRTQMIIYYLQLKYCTSSKTAQKDGSVTESYVISRAEPYECDLNLRLLISYIRVYGAPSKARNANVVYIWAYVWQR